MSSKTHISLTEDTIMAIPGVAPIMAQPVRRDWLRVVLVQLALLLAVAFVWLLWQVLVPISHTVVLVNGSTETAEPTP